MSLELMTLILIGGLLLLLAAGLEVAVSIGVMATVGLLLFASRPLDIIIFTAFRFMNSFELTAVPLFVFMGSIFADTGIIKNLFNAADKWFGKLPGGVACSVTGANAMFGAMCGSSIAAVATFGRIAFPDMERLGYSPRLALGSIAVGGTLSVLIPPSIILIIYGGLQTLSVPRLFAAGLIPGIILALLLMSTIVVQVKLNPSLAPKPSQVTWKERLLVVKDTLPFLVVPVLVLGVIFGGIMTPSESASMGAFLSVVISIAYRKMTFTALKSSMVTTVKVTAMVAFLVTMAVALSQVFQLIGLTDAFSSFMLQLPLGKYGTFAAICIMYIILGMFLEGFSMLTLTLPFVSPLMFSLGFDLIWFGVVYVVLAEIGMITPPFGLSLFALKSVVPQYGIMTIARGCVIFFVPLLITIVILTALPEIVLWLPHVLY